MARRSRGRQKRNNSSFTTTTSSSSSTNVEHLLRVLEVRAFVVVVVVVYVVAEIFQNAIFRNSFLFGGPSLLLSLVVHALTLSSLSLYLSICLPVIIIKNRNLCFRKSNAREMRFVLTTILMVLMVRKMSHRSNNYRSIFE